MRIAKAIYLVVMMIAIQTEVSCTQKQSSDCREFFQMSIEQQDAFFPTFPLDKQLELFRCGMNRRPPEIALAYSIARGEEKIIPELIEALRNEKDEWMQNAIIDIFRVMSDKGYLRGKTEPLQQIRETVARMKTSAIKKEAEESLKEIERNSSSSDK